jgi:hypothetical protein
MGMFDNIICEYKLPLPELSGDEVEELEEVKWDEESFQTTSFDGELITYDISSDGQLYEHKVSREWVKDDESPIGIRLEETDDGIEKKDYSGEIIFYSLIPCKKNDYWFEFKALFWKGDLKEIELLEHKKEDNKNRVEAQAKLEEGLVKLEKRRNKWWFSFYRVYRFIFGFTFSLIRRILEWELRALYWVERRLP